MTSPPSGFSCELANERPVLLNKYHLKLTISIDLRDHDGHLFLIDVLTKSLEDVGQLSGRDSTSAILIENVEGILEFTDLVVVKTQLGFQCLVEGLL